MMGNVMMFCRDVDQTALKLACPAEWQGASMGDLTVWVDPLDGTKEYTQVVSSIKELLLHYSHTPGPPGSRDRPDRDSCGLQGRSGRHSPALLQLQDRGRHLGQNFLWTRR